MIGNISTGRNASIGPVLSTPSSDAPQPFWKIAVTIPSAAPVESMFITAAVSGIAMLRNTTISSRKLSSTTMPTNSGSLAERTWLKSSKIAVCPPVSTFRPVPRSAVGTTLFTDRVQQVSGRGVLGRALRIDVRRSRPPDGRRRPE